MADAGKLLIPESLRKGKDIKEYSDVDISNLDEHFQEVCDQQQDFIEWEGPRQDPRVLLAGNRAPPATNSNIWGISDQCSLKIDREGHFLTKGGSDQIIY